MGIVTANKGKFWSKDGKTAQLITYSTNKSLVNKKTVINDKGAFSFYPDFPLFYIKETNTSTIANLKNSSFTFINAETTDDGYYIENFETTDKSHEIVMQFKNGELERFYVINPMGILYEYVITSYEVDDSEFDVPFLAVNVTPIYRFLILLGIIK